MIDLRFFVKPGRDGQIFVSLDSLIGFVRESADGVAAEQVELSRSLAGLADFLGEELERLKKHQKTIHETLSGIT